MAFSIKESIEEMGNDKELDANKKMLAKDYPGKP
jgi:hypothetical protein